MRRRVQFIGGPLDGQKKILRGEMVDYLGYDHNGREYLYEYKVRHSGGNKSPLKLAHRYVFMGHNGQLPDGVKEVDDER